MEKYYYNQDDYSADSRESVNGAFSPLKPTSSMDGLDFADEYDNFLTKKSRERGKERRELRKTGVSRKDARKQALSKIPKDKAKDIAKKVAQGVGKTILKGGLSAPRGAYLSLLVVNFRGFAYKIMAIENGTNRSLKQELKNKWESLGGNYNKLIDSASKGASKKPFFCGKNCKKKLIDADLTKLPKPDDMKSSFVNAIGGGDEFFNVTGVDDSVIVAYVGLASAITGALGTIVAKGIESRSQKREIESAERIAQKENESLTQSEKDKIALKEKELIMQGDPTNIILTNPNLTDEQRAIALKQLDEAESTGTQRKAFKYALYGGIALIVLYLGSKLIKSNK